MVASESLGGGHFFTESVWECGGSACNLHSAGSRIWAMDVVAVALGLLMFTILLGLIYAIDRI